ncbi:fibronectin type III domain-containing protein [Ramlibacter sp. H39-3-26]|uniref:fibronectin type III domain-containing protein n=1 Tax=Curvibacter soli TaxID=3031331 RepID=UPI0023D9DAED|nr:fibronectin type III domain-containing protein [Ramlibacter sp. H39-3-26]MDF1483934.1 fibronectin type III domain-containing protein [Ramlibacter sp. H39-3-26]
MKTTHTSPVARPARTRPFATQRRAWRLAPVALALAAAGFSVAAQAALVITETMSNGSVSVDWFELTNTGVDVVALTGYKMNDSGNAYALTGAFALAGVDSIAPGESVLFVVNPAGVATLTSSYGTCLTDVRLGNYSGGPGLGSNDGVIVFDGSGTQASKRAYPAHTSKYSFYYDPSSTDETTVAATLSPNTSVCGPDYASPGNTNSGVTRPAAPTVGAATATGSTGFTANWTAPSTGDAPTGYIVEVSTDSFTTVAKTVAAANTTSAAVTGLNPNTAYVYRVRAVNTGGPGANSTSQSVTTSPGLTTSLIDHSAYSSVIGDTNEQGYTFTVSDPAVTVTATSSVPTVVSNDGTGFGVTVNGAGTVTLKVNPIAVVVSHHESIG